MKKVGLLSLGCAKNLVDSEMILSSFKKAHYEVTSNPKEADVIIINTCAFIKKAQEESLKAILDMLTYQKKVIVTGCFAELYQEKLKKEYPNIDVVIPFSKYPSFNQYIKSCLKDKNNYNLNPNNRYLLTSKPFAYLRIAEGCNNFCSFCAIPYLRGRYRSRKIIDLIKETNILVNQGVKEIALIAQDLSAYGSDLKDKTNLVSLLKALEKIKKLKHIRLLYLYPHEITNEFINYMKVSKKVYPYFDIPLQHADNKILKAMNRKGSHEASLKVLNKIRETIPNAIFRTTFMVGFPGETNASFKVLYNFVRDFQFDLMGSFTYSREAMTKSYHLPHQVNEQTKIKRQDALMKLQAKISLKKKKEKIGEVFEGLYLGKDTKNKYAHFLTKYNSSDGTDGEVLAKVNKKLVVGQYYQLKVIDASIYDLFVEIL